MVAPTPTAPEVEGLAHGAEHDLVVGVGYVQERVVVQLADEGDAVHVLARGQPERAQRGGDGVALAGEGQLDDVQRIEVGRVLREARRGGVLDALVDREDGDVARAAQAPVVEHGAEVAQHGGAAVRVGEHPIEVVGTGEGQVLGGERLGRVAQEGVGVVAQERMEVGAHGRPAYRRRDWALLGGPAGRGRRAGVGAVLALAALFWLSVLVLFRCCAAQLFFCLLSFWLSCHEFFCTRR